MTTTDFWRSAGLGLTLTALGFACAPREAVAPGAGQVVLSEASPPAGYVKLKDLAVSSGRGCGVLGERGSAEGARTKLRNEALALGASYVQITSVQNPPVNHECMEHEYKLAGAAYRSSEAAAPPPAVASAARHTSPARDAVLVQDYEPGSPASKPSASTEVSRVNIALAPGEKGGNALSVDYGCSGTEQRASLDVWSETRVRDWTQAGVLSFRIKPDSAMRLSVSFLDANHAGYTQKTQPLVAGSWQSVSLLLEQFRLNPFGPQGNEPGRPVDFSGVQALGFAPEGCSNGHFLIDDFSLSTD